MPIDILPMHLSYQPPPRVLGSCKLCAFKRRTSSADYRSYSTDYCFGSYKPSFTRPLQLSPNARVETCTIAQGMLPLSQTAAESLEDALEGVGYKLVERRPCALCNNARRPVDSFNSDTNPICKKHGDVIMTTRVPAGLDGAIKAKLDLIRKHVSCWLSIPRVLCVRRRQVLGWHVETSRCTVPECAREHVNIECYLRWSSTPQRGLTYEVAKVNSGGLSVIESNSEGHQERQLDIKTLDEVWAEFMKPVLAGPDAAG